MLSIIAPSKFVLTLQSIPPYIFENILVLVFVIILSYPLILRIKKFLENLSNNDLIIANQRSNIRKYDNNDCQIIRHKAFIPINSRISINQIDTILPVTQIPTTVNQVNLNTSENTTDLIDSSIILSAYNYDYYRNKIIEKKLSNQYGNKQAPGNVVLNSLHLNTIDSKTGIKIGEKYNNDIFDFIEELHNSNSQIKIEYYDPLKHFLRKKNYDKCMTIDCATGTNEFTNNDIDKKIDNINSTGQQKIIQKSIDKRKPIDTSVVEKNNNIHRVKSPRISNRSELIDNSSRPSSAARDKIHNTPNKLIKNKAKLKNEVVQKRPTTPASPISKDTVKKVDNIEKADNIKLNEKVSSSCSSNVSSDEFNIKKNNTPIKVIDKRINSRPSSSSSGLPSKTMKTLKSKIQSRPKTSDNFDWDVPDVTGKNYFQINTTGQDKQIKSKLQNSLINDSKKNNNDDSMIDVPVQINSQKFIDTSQNTEMNLNKKNDDLSKNKRKTFKKNDNIDAQLSSNTFGVNENSLNFETLLECNGNNLKISADSITGNESVCTIIEKYQKIEEPIDKNNKEEKIIETSSLHPDVSKITTTGFISKLPVLSYSTISKDKK
ncbi:hypothetical protein HCN44_001869 [Aphidius gifuensis]|uniref:Uncharacterized protein n=1 Tax=Aphidius gifuensis TaxID=684658 RepID=A0A834Y266_APHGI|nr:putative uncharacterized protein DDB_G0282499 [Aphidius gifuensis]KAF7996237.1 hypothetical protein HCN44_001869 [Aphidius gifuensis]